MSMKRLLRILPILCICIGQVHGDELANLSLNYCTTSENTLQYKINPWVQTGICYTIDNRSAIPLNIKVLFVDGTFTNDQQKNKACLSDTAGENFWKFVTGYAQNIMIKAGETVKKEAKLLYPLGMEWLYHGCIVYSIVEKQASTGMSIIMRKAKFIDVIVGNPKTPQGTGIILESFMHGDGENLSSDPQIRIYKDDSDKTYNIQIKVKNISSVDQDVVITGELSNILSYQDTFVETRRILKGEVSLITKKIENIPLYNLKVKLIINNIPFSFSAQKPVVWITKKETTIWIWDIVCYLTIIWIVFLISTTIFWVHHIKKRRRKRIIHTHHLNHHTVHHHQEKKN